MVRIVAFAIFALAPITCAADPIPAPAPPIVPPLAPQVTVTNAGAPAIVHLSISPIQNPPSTINVLDQPLHPGVTQTIAVPSAQQCCYTIKAVYSDGHTVTIPFWNVTNIPVITIPH